MLFFTNNNPKCRTCIPVIGFKLIGIGIIGSMIGFAGLLVVEQPPSTLLISATEQQTEEMCAILVKLDAMEKDINAIKNNLMDIKQKLNIKKP